MKKGKKKKNNKKKKHKKRFDDIPAIGIINEIDEFHLSSKEEEI